MKKIIIVICLIIISVTSLYFYNEYKFKSFLNNIEKQRINVDNYYIYGNHLNFSGTIDNIEEAKLVLKSKSEEIEYNITIRNNNYYVAKNINEGINLEKLNNEKYYILLKTNNKYYSFNNNTNYKNATYYSLIKENKVNKMNVNFNEYFNIDSKKSNDTDIYDIVIDAGHGGKDSGATNGKYYESDLTYEYATTLKKELSKLGYKVKLTRDKNGGIKTYGKNGRIAISHEVHAKYLISIHFNSSEDYITQSGVEVYAPNNANLKLATSLANSIVKSVNLDYSTNTAYKIKNGVYVKTFRQSDINLMNDEARENNYSPYNITIDTPYLYIIRETGGIITNAFVDGRDSRKDKNPYYNSNIGTESYLLELGYLNNSKDLNVILNEKKAYIKAISKTLDKHIKNNS